MTEILHTERLCDESFSPTNRIYVKDGDVEYHRDYIVRLPAVSAVVYNTSTNKYLFVKQFRPGSKNEIVELVAGMIDDENLTPLETIKKEISEELGYKTDFVKFLSKSYTAAGYTDEIIHYYYAEVSKKINSGGGLDSENEFIETVEMNYTEVLDYDFQDSKCYLCFGLLGIIKIDKEKVFEEYDKYIYRLIRVFSKLDWKSKCDRDEASLLMKKVFIEYTEKIKKDD